MTAHRDNHTVEIAVDQHVGEALAAYQDLALDGAVGLRLDHATGTLTAVVDDGRGRRTVSCGTVSTRMAGRLRPFRRVLWARLEGEDAVAVSEIALEHAHV